MVLVDRSTEMGVMQGLVDGAREGSSAVLVLRGQAGIGKTALLREMAEQAANRGMRIARAVGIQAEMEMDFAGLHQLLLPGSWGPSRTSTPPVLHPRPTRGTWSSCAISTRIVASSGRRAS